MAFIIVMKGVVIQSPRSYVTPSMKNTQNYAQLANAKLGWAKVLGLSISLLNDVIER